jgi:multidrug efflux system membrane fusion protein
LPRRLAVRLAAIAGALLILLPGCQKPGEHAATPPQRPPAPVTVALAQSKDVPLYLDEIGKTAASEFVTIQAQVSGQIQQRRFTDGAELKQGDLLFTIDPRPFQAALAQADATANQRRAELEFAKQDFVRVQELIATKAISQQEFDQKKNAVAVSEAQVKAADAAIQTAKLNLEYCTIRSPIDGRAGQRQVDAGNIVKANDDPLLVIQRLDPIYADFTTNERNLDTVRRHMADHTLKVQVWVPGEPADEKPRDGELTFLDTAVQPGAGTVKLRATLPNADRRFWAGQFVNVRLVLQIKKDAVLVPATAVQIAQQGPFVYVVKPDSTAELRPVVQGQRQGDQVVIDKGVNAGDQVVTTGQMGVAPGAKVHVLPPQGPSAPGAPPAHADEQPKSQEHSSKDAPGVAKS